MKLLIVDDSKIMRESIRSIVADSKDTVFECEHGSLVLDIYSKEKPDFILMDLNMPKMNGIEATKNLKSKFPEARVIIVTDFNDDEFRNEVQSAGAEKYFLKDNLLDIRTYLINNI